METIKSYLDNMFSSLPDTAQVRRVKEELYQMMEDKYFELKEQGKSEHEAIGIVITEFGDLEEIKEELGIHKEQKENSFGYEETSIAHEEASYISLNQAKEYLGAVRQYSKFIALGTMLCIFSPVVLIFLCGYAEISDFSEKVAGFGGLIALFVFIAVAVAIFIYTGIRMEEYEYLKKEVIKMDETTEAYIKEERKRNNPFFSIKIAIGVVLCILGVIPLLGSAFFFDDNDFAAIVSVCILLIIIGIAVVIFIIAGMPQEAYKILLQEGDYEKEKKGKSADAISTVYWCIVTAIYLGWSFWTFRWEFTWIIWPIAGVLYGAIMAIYSAVRKSE